ncbi:protein kinase domain-containing protein [Melittangium boletus]|uniref:protein kinase domain-containing protein n=1 Tax=Melittangium boletus TaxID=83453 RepID=UPI003DA39182
MSEQTVSSRPRGKKAVPALKQVGRYVLLKQLGEGGMGVVYMAYDPDLDRAVALKLLRADGRANSEDARARLLREAQAMARVSHANVIPIFDVGVWGEQVFLAMELVEGQTLGEWLRANERPAWREVLGKFVDAGRGLLAAHEAGLVHRDFKPGNVLMDRRGRVFVTDFGLARQVEKGEQEQTSLFQAAGLLPAGVEHRMLEVDLTETGSVMGTPNYMSPEQFRGAGVDVRSDQFSFCVSLYWALYRQRPFEPDALRRAVQSGVAAETPGAAPTRAARREARARLPAPPLILEPPRDSPVPAWVRQALLRGLSVEPGQRFASMGELLEALSQEARLRRRRGWRAAAAAGVVGVSLVGTAVYQRSRVCVGAGELMAEVWNPAARQRVEGAFAATGLAFAPDVSGRVAGVLDGYTRAWSAQRVAACEATRLRGVQTEALLERREACLERRRQDVRALVDELSRADGTLVEKSVDAALALPVLGECENVEALAERQRLPEDAGQRERISALDERLARLKVLVDTGRYAPAREAVGPLVEAAENTGYAPLMAEAHAQRGWLRFQLSELEAARGDLVRAAHEAEAGRAERVKAEALGRLLYVDTRREHFDTAEEWGGWTEAALRRMGGDALLEGGLLFNRAHLALSRGQLPAARALFERAGAVWQRVLPPEHPRRARLGVMLGRVLVQEGQAARGVEVLREALARLDQGLGALHPDTVTAHYALAWALREQGELERALTQVREVVRRHEALHGPAHVRTAEARDEEGQGLLGLKRYPEALAVYQRALADKRRVLAPDDTSLQYSYDGVGQALLGLGRVREALSPLRLAVSFASVEPEALAESGFALARALRGDGQAREALVQARQARDLFLRAGEEGRAAEVLAWMAPARESSVRQGRRP